MDVGHDKGLVVFAHPFKMELVVVLQFLHGGRKNCAELVFVLLIGANPNYLGVFAGIEAANMTGYDMLLVARGPLERTLVFDGNRAVLRMSGQQIRADIFIDRVLAVPAVAFVEGRPITVHDMGPACCLCPYSDLLQAEVVLKPGEAYLGWIEGNGNRLVAALQGNLLSGCRDSPQSQAAAEFGIAVP